jgi:hypothetical protein
LISSTIFIWKLRNYFIAKKAGISELDYWKQHYLERNK